MFPWLIALVLSPYSTAVFDLDCYSHRTTTLPVCLFHCTQRFFQPLITPIYLLYAAGRPFFTQSPWANVSTRTVDRSVSGTHIHLLSRRRFTSTDSYGKNSPRTKEEWTLCLEQASYGWSALENTDGVVSAVFLWHNRGWSVKTFDVVFIFPSMGWQCRQRPRRILQPRIRHPRCSSARGTGTPVAPTGDSKRNTLLSALFWPFHELLRSPFRKTLPLSARFWPRETFFHRPHSRVLFFGRLQYRPFLGDFDTVRPRGDLHHNRWPSHFLQRFIFVRSLQFSPNTVCYGSVLFSVSV